MVKARELRLLVVDDEKSITDLLTMALSDQVQVVKVAHSGKEALASLRGFHPHLVILDVMLPDLDGFAVLDEMLKLPDCEDIPVLFLSARRELNDRLRGLERGADYVTKPFSVEEITLRVKAILARTVRHSQTTWIQVGDLKLNCERHLVTRAREQLDLTPTEFRLLAFLMAHEGRVMSKSQIREHVWDYGYYSDGNTIEVYISHLRHKLDGSGDPTIRTIRGLGYMLRAPALHHESKIHLLTEES